MKKILLFILVLCGLQGATQTLADSIARAKFVYDSLTKAAQAAKHIADTTKSADSALYRRKAADIQSQADTQKVTLNILIKRSKSFPTEAAAANTTVKDTTGNKCNCMPVYNPDWNKGGIGGWLVFTPLLIFIAIGVIVALWLKAFNIKDALSENNSSKVTIRNPEYTAANIGSPPLPAAPLSPAVMANLITLIPPTIEITPTDNAAGTALGQPAPEYRPSISRFIALLSTLVIIIIVISMSGLFIYRYIAYGCPPDFSGLTGMLLALGLGMVPYTVNKVANAATDKNKAV